ncbi:hypothetical protein SDC9_160021 [bioreactor metagenome]|uniref:Uncharacterized protein n=1 Tax=bioreactor metagenome TaxID=1076179 RepID=A0A645FGT1_9ZZZZ
MSRFQKPEPAKPNHDEQGCNNDGQPGLKRQPVNRHPLVVSPHPRQPANQRQAGKLQSEQIGDHQEAQTSQHDKNRKCEHYTRIILILGHTGRR